MFTYPRYLRKKYTRTMHSDWFKSVFWTQFREKSLNFVPTACLSRPDDNMYVASSTLLFSTEIFERHVIISYIYIYLMNYVGKYNGNIVWWLLYIVYLLENCVTLFTYWREVVCFQFDCEVCEVCFVQLLFHFICKYLICSEWMEGGWRSKFIE